VSAPGSASRGSRSLVAVGEKALCESAFSLQRSAISEVLYVVYRLRAKAKAFCYPPAATPAYSGTRGKATTEILTLRVRMTARGRVRMTARRGFLFCRDDGF